MLLCTACGQPSETRDGRMSVLSDAQTLHLDSNLASVDAEVDSDVTVDAGIPQPVASFAAGYAKVDMTPQLGTYLGGFGSRATNEVVNPYTTHSWPTLSW